MNKETLCTFPLLCRGVVMHHGGGVVNGHYDQLAIQVIGASRDPTGMHTIYPMESTLYPFHALSSLPRIWINWDIERGEEAAIPALCPQSKLCIPWSMSSPGHYCPPV